MTAHEPNPDQRRTAARNKPSKPPEGGSPLGRLDAEALDSQRAHERDLADRGARPVEDREPGTPVYPPFGQSGVPLVDDNGAPFPEETQQLFREVAQDAYLRGIRDQREREQAGKRRKCTSGHYLTDEGAHGEGQTWCGAGPEPVGPYAPTRNTDHPVVNMKLDAACPTCKHLVAAHVRDSDGAIVCSVCQMPETERAWLAERFDRIEEMVASQRQDDIGQQQAISNAYDQGHERGRQQGDADRAEREQACRDEGFRFGKTAGAAEREAELLDQGWTPPGAVHELEVTSYPTEYEVWRDAVSIAGAQRDRRPPAKDLADRITADAEWFWELLQQVPVLKFEDRTKSSTNPDDDVQTEPRMGAGND